MTNIKIITVISIALVPLYFVFDYSVNASEKVECNKWLKESYEYEQYYITSWQEKQCARQGVFINAPIK